MLTPTEHQEQAAVIEWCDLVSKYRPELALIFAIPNGSNKSPSAAEKFKREGLKSGVPDLFLPVATEYANGLFIEMKRKKGGTVSSAQKDWKEKLEKQGYKVVICKGADKAIEVLKQYLDI